MTFKALIGFGMKQHITENYIFHVKYILTLFTI